MGGDLVLAGHAKVSLGARVAADVVLERASGDLTLTDDTGTRAFGLTDLRLAIAAQDGSWYFTQALAGSNLGVLAGAQSLRLPLQATWPRSDTPMQGVLEWRVADLGAWAPFTPPGWRLSGTLRTGAELGGTFGAPEITGALSGHNLAVRNLLLGVDVRDGELALSLRGDQARIDGFVFKGGQGELRLTGGASLGAEPSAKLQLDAERFQLLGRFDRRIIASGNATLVLAPQSLNLDGRFRIDEGLIDFSRVDAPSLDSDIQVHGGRAAAKAVAATEPANGGRGSPRTVQVALQVDLGDDLKLRGHGIDTRLRGSLALSTPGGRMAVNGSVRTEAGSFAAYGQKLAIERGVLTFNGPADNPRLDILALRPNLDQRVGVLVSGSVQLPRVRLYSEPEMSDTDKLSWLVLGRAPDGLARADTALLQRAALALLAGGGEGKDKTLLSNVGLDELSVRQTETGDVKETVVTLGKQLSRRWYVGYERGVNATTGTWQLIYRVAQRLTLRAQAGADNALDAIWTWRWN
jgi:translocation and assembly module TamB